MKSWFNKNVLAIYITSLFSYQLQMAVVLLGSMYAWYPNLSENVVVLMYSAPSFLAAAVSLAISPLMKKVNKKMLLVLGMCSILASGCLIVFTGGHSFPLALTGAILTGIGYALIVSTTNTLLVENTPPSESGKAIGINMAVGCLGAMFLTTVSGILAADGNWVRAYCLCFPTAISLVLFLLLYRQERNAPVRSEPVSHEAEAAQSAQTARSSSTGLFCGVLLLFLLMMLTATAWNANFSSYVLENRIGTAANSGMIATMSALGGVIGGFFFTGFAIKYLKKLVVPICLLVVAAPCLAGAVGVRSMILIYLCSFLFMLFFQPAYSVFAATAGTLKPGPGVSIVNSVQGFGQFLGPYVVTFVGGILGASLSGRFWSGVLFAVVAAVLAVPIMRRAQD